MTTADSINEFLDGPALPAAFTDRYAKSAAWANTFWLGQQVVKPPADLWIYQEIIHDTKPELIIETGSCIGGSAYYFATLFDLIDSQRRDDEPLYEGGRIVTVDKDPYPNQPAHRRITYHTGDSVSEETLDAMRAAVVATGAHRVMVVLDSDHSYRHVAREIERYKEFVSPGCYLVVEDTTTAPGALRAARDLIAQDDRFVVDESREKHLMTFMTEGWIRRVT